MEPRVYFPAVTPEGLYHQDKRRRDWDEAQRKIDKEIEKVLRLTKKELVS